MGNLYSKSKATVVQSTGYAKHSTYISWNCKYIKADINTFEDLGFGYAKDKNNTFYNGDIITNTVENIV